MQVRSFLVPSPSRRDVQFQLGLPVPPDREVLISRRWDALFPLLEAYNVLQKIETRDDLTRLRYGIIGWSHIVPHLSGDLYESGKRTPKKKYAKDLKTLADIADDSLGDDSRFASPPVQDLSLKIFTKNDWSIKLDLEEKKPVEMYLVSFGRKIETGAAVASLRGEKYCAASLTHLYLYAIHNRTEVMNTQSGQPVIALYNAGGNMCPVICRGTDNGVHLAAAMFDGGSGWPERASFLAIKAS